MTYLRGKTTMKITEILDLDCRIKENRETIQKVLKQIKPLAKCPEGNDIPIVKLEKCLQVICRNYALYPREIHPDIDAAEKDIVWRFILIDRNNLTTIGTCYGLTIYELMCKAVIMAYALSRKRSKVN